MIQSKSKPERRYIGSAINLDARRKCHFSLLKHNRHHSTKLQRHYNKYGEKDLEFKVIIECPPSELLIEEQYFIDKHHPWFNINPFAINRLGTKQSIESRIKNANSNKGKHFRKMGPMSEEAKQRMSEARLGTKLKPETIAKMMGRPAWNKGLTKEVDSRVLKYSLLLKGIPKSEESKKKISEAKKGKTSVFKGKRHTEESLIKMRNTKLGKKPSSETRAKLSLKLIGNTRAKGVISPKRKPICQYSIDGSFIKEWESATLAAKDLNISLCSVSVYANGKRSSPKNYILKYKIAS